MTARIDVKRYASELLFHAAVGNAWDVSEVEFATIVAMLHDGTPMTMQERADALLFVQMAREEAETLDPFVADVASIHRLACESALARGLKVGNVSPLPTYLTRVG